MDANYNQANGVAAQCCSRSCNDNHPTAEGEIINQYKCDQPAFSTADLWRIRKMKKQFSIRNNFQ